MGWMSSFCLSPGRVFVPYDHSSLRSTWESLVAILAIPPRVHCPDADDLHFARGSETYGRAPVRGVWYSILLHVSVMALLVQLSFAPPVSGARQLALREYELTTIDLSKYLPALRSRGPGGAPGRGTKPERPPARGATSHHPKMTLVSAPIRPDNTRQTIIQPDSPPDLRIPFELNVPNVIIPSQMPALKRPMPSTIRAPQNATGVAAVEKVSAPQIQSEITARLDFPLDRAPQLPVPPPPPAAGSADGSATPSNQGPLILLTVGGRPAGLDHSLALPPGNRYGEFSISPDGGLPGSPGGVPGGDPDGGRGGKGAGGDGVSTGPGAGGNGGGGEGSAKSGIPISVSGSAAGAGAEATNGEEERLQGTVASLGIYAVPGSVVAPPNLLQVTSGPGGGGGLRVYGVLRGSKVHTTYLSMPGKSWTLQYCQLAAASSTPEHRSPAKVVQFGPGLVPPIPEARFDFRRENVPAEKSHEMIILHGVISETGTVRDVRVLQGVTSELDKAATEALRRWEFRPATLGGRPVAVEILVGIPAASSAN